jgi:hypothetical protein
MWLGDTSSEHGKKNWRNFSEKSEISLLTVNPKKLHIAQNFQPNLNYAPDRAPKDPRPSTPAMQPKKYP